LLTSSAAFPRAMENLDPEHQQRILEKMLGEHFHKTITKELFFAVSPSVRAFVASKIMPHFLGAAPEVRELIISAIDRGEL